MGDRSSGVPLVLLRGGPGIPGETFTGLMRQLSTRRPGSQWRVFERSAHFSYLEEPELYAEVVTDFLDGIDRGVSLSQL